MKPKGSSELDELKYKAEKSLYDLFYKGLDAGEDTVLQYQFDRELGYRTRYAERCISSAKSDLADLLVAYARVHLTAKLSELLEKLPKPHPLKVTWKPQQDDVMLYGENKAIKQARQAIEKMLEDLK